MSISGCKHVTCNTRLDAVRDGGRYWDANASQWVCTVCDGIINAFMHEEKTHPELSKLERADCECAITHDRRVIVETLFWRGDRLVARHPGGSNEDH